MQDDLWLEFRRRLKAGQPQKSKDIWTEWFGDWDADEGGMFFDGDGNDRTAVVTALVDRIDQLTIETRTLADRVKVLERLAVHDEKRLAEEIEKLRGL